MSTPIVRRRIALLFAGFAAIALSASACGGDTRACNDCPNVGGTWAVAFDQNGAVPAECDQVGLALPQDPLQLQQVGSALTTTVSGVELRGTLYDTFEFNLNGANQADGGVSNNVSLSGRYVPAQGAIDAGERLDGTFTATRNTTDANCVLTRKYTATRP